MKLGTMIAGTGRAGTIGVQYISLSERLEAIKHRLADIDRTLESTSSVDDLKEEICYTQDEMAESIFQANRSMDEEDEFDWWLQEVKAVQVRMNNLRMRLMKACVLEKEKNAALVKEAAALREERAYVRQLLGI